MPGTAVIEAAIDAGTVTGGVSDGRGCRVWIYYQAGHIRDGSVYKTPRHSRVQTYVNADRRAGIDQ